MSPPLLSLAFGKGAAPASASTLSQEPKGAGLPAASAGANLQAGQRPGRITLPSTLVTSPFPRRQGKKSIGLRHLCRLTTWLKVDPLHHDQLVLRMRLLMIYLTMSPWGALGVPGFQTTQSHYLPKAFRTANPPERYIFTAKPIQVSASITHLTNKKYNGLTIGHLAIIRRPNAVQSFTGFGS